MKNPRLVSLFEALLLATFVLFAPALVHADVVHRGQWPTEENVSLSLAASPRLEAVQRLAAAAGWSLIAEGVDDTKVSVDVRDQPAEKVLTLLLSGGDFVVERDGTLVSVRAHAEPAADQAAKHVQTPAGKPGEDLFVTEQGHVGKDQVVRDLFVVGSAVVEGTVTGSVVVFGGQVHLVRGAHVSKDAIAFGGALEIDDGVEIGGDVAALFGALRRGDGPTKECLTCVDKQQDPWQEFFADVFGHLTSAVIVWLLGAMMLAMAGARLSLLREEIEHRPLRTLGVGVAVLVASLVLIATLVFTLLGIPLAVLSAVVGVAATYLAFAALPLALGRRLVGKRSVNPYAHLAVGCGVLFLVFCIPVVGAIVSVLGSLTALGALFSTRAAGLFKRPSGTVSV